MFNRYTRMLSMVPRWSVAPVIQQQSVAEHSYYVALYTMEMLPLTNLSDGAAKTALEYALQHDLAECRTGDFPGPVKHRVIDVGLLGIYEAATERELIANRRVVPNDEIRGLIKVADMIDEVFFMAYQCSMGNSLLWKQLETSIKRFEKALMACSCLEAKARITITQDVMDQVGALKAGDFYLPHAKEIIEQ